MKDKIEKLTKESEDGNPVSQYNLGIMYAFGKGINKDMKKACELWKLASDQGHSASQFNLGCCYMVGNGVDKDVKKSNELIEKASINLNFVQI